MLTFNHDDQTHWDDLIDAFTARLGNLTDAAEVERCLQLTMAKTLRLLRNAASEWNKKNSTLVRAIPPETWAACFSFLSVGECITVSHVSRSWRAIACGFPHLWSHIDLPFTPCGSLPEDTAANTISSTTPRAGHALNAANVFEMVLARSGQRLLDINVAPGRYTRTIEDAGRVLSENMHRVRSISWPFEPARGMFERPAPFLEEIVCADLCPIPDNLLGGVPGRLRRLEVRHLWLPPSCPALRTVTHFTARLRYFDHQHPTQRDALKGLFERMPRLESLTLSHLSPQFDAFLPLAGPAPSTLTHLSLASVAKLCDLAQYVAAWRTERLQTVTLAARLDSFERTDNIALFQNAVALAVGPISLKSVRFKVDTATGMRCTLLMTHENLAPSRVALSAVTILRQAQDALVQLRELAAPIAVVDAFLAGGESSPLALERVRTTMRKTTDAPVKGSGPRGSRRYFEFDKLAFLASFPRPLSRLVIGVESDFLLYADDAKRLVDAVAALGNRSGCEIAVEGFESDVVHGLDVRDTGIVFVKD